MKLIWYTRYYLARYSIQFGLFVLPEGRYKTELVQLIYGLKDKVISEVSGVKNEH